MSSPPANLSSCLLFRRRNNPVWTHTARDCIMPQLINICRARVESSEAYYCGARRLRNFFAFCVIPRHTCDGREREREGEIAKPRREKREKSENRLSNSFIVWRAARKAITAIRMLQFFTLPPARAEPFRVGFVNHQLAITSANLAYRSQSSRELAHPRPLPRPTPPVDRADGRVQACIETNAIAQGKAEPSG